jgi:hypothetical protein
MSIAVRAGAVLRLCSRSDVMARISARFVSQREASSFRLYQAGQTIFFAARSRAARRRAGRLVLYANCHINT